LVRNNDQRVDITLKLSDPGIGQTHPVTAFELEGLGHNADSQNAALTGALGDDGGSSGSGAATHTSGDENHMGTVEMLANFRRGLFGSRHAHFRMGPGPEALGHLNTQLDASVGLGEGQLLSVCVGHYELNTLETRIDHIVYSVAAGTPDAKHYDAGLQFRRTRSRQLNSHRPKSFEPTSANRPLGAFVVKIN
jgi:hypothetical protein